MNKGTAAFALTYVVFAVAGRLPWSVVGIAAALGFSAFCAELVEYLTRDQA